MQFSTWALAVWTQSQNTRVGADFCKNPSSANGFPPSAYNGMAHKRINARQKKGQLGGPDANTNFPLRLDFPVLRGYPQT